MNILFDKIIKARGTQAIVISQIDFTSGGASTATAPSGGGYANGTIARIVDATS